MIELECDKCGKPAAHYIMVHGKLYVGEDGITDNGHGDNHKFWCLSCVVRGAREEGGLGPTNIPLYYFRQDKERKIEQ